MITCTQNYYKKEGWSKSGHLVFVSFGGKQKVFMESLKNYNDNAPKIRERSGSRGGFVPYISAEAIEYLLIGCIEHVQSQINFASWPDRVVVVFDYPREKESTIRTLFDDGFDQSLTSKKRIMLLKQAFDQEKNGARVSVQEQGEKLCVTVYAKSRTQKNRYYYEENGQYLNKTEVEFLNAIRNGIPAQAEELSAALSLSKSVAYKYISSLKRKRLIQ